MNKLIIICLLSFSLFASGNIFDSYKGCLNLKNTCYSNIFELKSDITHFYKKNIRDKLIFYTPKFSIAGYNGFRIVKKVGEPYMYLINTQYKIKEIKLKYNLIGNLKNIESLLFKCSVEVGKRECLERLSLNQKIKPSLIPPKYKSSEPLLVSKNIQPSDLYSNKIYKINNYVIQIKKQGNEIILEWIDLKNPFEKHISRGE